jgi:hypothetical protein
MPTTAKRVLMLQSCPAPIYLRRVFFAIIHRGLRTFDMTGYGALEGSFRIPINIAAIPERRVNGIEIERLQASPEPRHFSCQ